MSFYHLPHPWNPGYAIPKYVMAEPPGRGAITTKWLPRGTISAMPADYLAKPAAGQPGEMKRNFVPVPQSMGRKLLGRNDAQLGSLSGNTLSKTTLSCNSLSGDTLGTRAEVYKLEPLGGEQVQPGFPGDPFKAYGQRVSELIMGTIKTVPAEWREEALKALLNELQPNLFARVTERATRYKGEGLNAKAAIKAAIASSVGQGIGEELVKIGQSGKPPAGKSLAGLGSSDYAYKMALDGLWGSITGAASKVKSTIAGGAKAVTSTVGGAGKWVGGKVSSGAGAVWDGTKWVGGKVASGAKTAYGWGATALSKIRKLTCTVLNSPVSDIAAGAASAAYGVPPQVGVAGKQIVQGIACPPGTKEISQEQLNTENGLLNSGGLPGWVLPAALAAGGLGLFMVLKK